MTIEELAPERVVNNTMATFSTCGNKGRFGPSIAQCMANYHADSAEASMLQSVNSGIQRVEVPETGLYLIRAEGARGGDAYIPDDSKSSGYWGGHGAVAWGLFQLEKGQVLNLVVGQPGDWRSTAGTHDWGGGGGGGSFVWKDGETTPLVVAGGGGGAAAYSNNKDYWGAPGQAGTSGSKALNGRSANAGTSGNGGTGNNGGGGAGWFSAVSCDGCGNSRNGGFVGGVDEATPGQVAESIGAVESYCSNLLSSMDIQIL